jgi:hypothetical protein
VSSAKQTDRNDGDELLPPTLFERIEEVVRMAQDLSLPPTPYKESGMLSDELVPALYGARTYIEVGQITEPEVHAGISRALRVAYRLADMSRKYNTVVNRLRILLEDADRISSDTKALQKRQS